MEPVVCSVGFAGKINDLLCGSRHKIDMVGHSRSKNTPMARHYRWIVRTWMPDIKPSMTAQVSETAKELEPVLRYAAQVLFSVA